MSRSNTRLGSHLYIDDAPVIHARPLGGSTVTVAQLDDDNPIQRLSAPLDDEDALLVSVQFRDVPEHAVVENGVESGPCDLRNGQAVFYDLRRNPRIQIRRPFRTVTFHIPRAAFNELEEEAHSPPIGDIRYEPGAGIDDCRILNVGSVLLPELARPERAFPLFVGYVALALVTHVAAHYGGLVVDARAARGGLAPWQARRAKEMLASNLDGNIQLEHVAQECGLSVSHFSRAFRGSVGLPPHRWLIKRRVEAAKTLMREGTNSLCDIALRCGFADQSHFTRAFTRETGASPGQWRRCISA